MTATNHALTGAIIGLTAVNPLPAVLLAFVSHYFLDIMPHFGLPEKNETKLKSVWFRNYLLVEASLCFLIVLTLFLRQPTHWWLGALCAFAAASPDLFSINQFLTVRAGKKWRPNLYSRLAGGIQWFERPIGAVVEIVWAVSAIYLLVKIV